MNSPRFVILRHEFPQNSDRQEHFDLMLERGESLVTWAIPQLPEHAAVIDAEQLVDHRRKYLEYEGEISGGRGSVRRVESGTCQWVEYTTNRMVVSIQGSHLCGQLTLTRIDGRNFSLGFQRA